MPRTDKLAASGILFDAVDEGEECDDLRSSDEPTASDPRLRGKRAISIDEIEDLSGM